jgi:magnesium and cobalt transporter
LESASQVLTLASGVLFAASAVLSLATGALSAVDVSAAVAPHPPGRRERLRRALRDAPALLGAVRLAGILLDSANMVCLVVLWRHAWPAAGDLELVLVAGAAVLGLLVLAGGIPAAVGRRYPEAVACRVALPLRRWLAPFRWPARWLGLAGGRLGPRPGQEAAAAEAGGGLLVEEIRTAVSVREREMIEGIFDLRGQRLHEVMTPRTDMATLAADTPLAEAVRFASESGHSRIPVHGENRDEIVGILYAKDLLALWDAPDRADRPLRQLLRKPLFMPETTLVTEVMREMRARKVHLAIAVDEYGGTAGLVTIEDILEEIVGEIQDEYDDEAVAEDVRTIDAQTVELSGRARLADAESALGVELPDNGTYETVGGLLIASIGIIPQKGDQFAVNGFEFTVLDADERRIKRLRLHVRETHAEAAG